MTDNKELKVVEVELKEETRGGEKYFEFPLGLERALFTTFSGTDAIVNIDGRKFASLRSIKWREDLLSGKVNGELGFVVYTETAKTLRLELNKHEFLRVEYTSEYGATGYQELKNVEFKYRESFVSVDNIILEVVYHFVADSIEEDYENLQKVDAE